MANYLPDTTAPTGYLPKETGTVPYAVSWNAALNTYGESGSEKTPTAVTAKIQCNWLEASDFSAYARGFAKPDPANPGYLKRFLPLKNPWDYEMYCQDVNFSKLGADAGPEATDPKWPNAEWIEYTCNFAVRPYDLRSDAATKAIGSELARYVTRRMKYVYSERRLNAYTLKAATGDDIINVPSFLPYVGGELTYTWHMVPAECVDFVAIRNALGKVNSESFDPESYYGDRPIGGPFAAETLLFKGFAGEWPTYPMANGRIAFDIPFVFKLNPIGFNKFPKGETGTFIDIVLRQNGQKPYVPTSFHDLFKARV